MSRGASEPGCDCALCPRLAAFRMDWRCREAGWFNAPVPSFGPPGARLLIVGLAPGLKGANRTGRPFTGDYAGDLLYDTLKRFGFASGNYEARPDDGLTLVDARITNAVRCVPPENKPTGVEIKTCRPFLAATIAGMIHDRSADTSLTGLAVHAAQWIASGFVAISVATLLAITVTAVRWPGRGRGPAGAGPPPPAGGADRPRHAQADPRRGGSTRG